MSTAKPPVVCLMGPTASGKTAMAIKLVQDNVFDIISVDSAMVYRGMDIGTAKPSAEELAVAPHRLIDIRDPSEAYSAADFVQDATLQINAIYQQGRIPLLVGGTMLYFQVLQQGLSPLPPANAEVRRQLTKQAELHGEDYLYQRLSQVDPPAAKRIHRNDPQRIQRALEVFEITGRSMTALWAAKSPPVNYQFTNIALIPAQRERLHQHIEQRFSQMMEQGFMVEVDKLFKRGDLTADLPAIRAVGYRQAWRCLCGEYDEQTMIIQAITATRQLAKRQITWLKNSIYAQCFDAYDAELVKKLKNYLTAHKK